MTLRVLTLVLLPASAALALGVGRAAAQGGDCQGWIPPNTLVLMSGSPQQGEIGKPFQTNLQVALANTNGCPLTGSWAGVSVVFAAPGSGASGTFASTGTNVADVGTDANGSAMAPPFAANRAAGNYSVAATSAYGSVTLYLTNTADGVAASIAARGARSRTATVGTSYKPLQAIVLDANGHPVAGASVSFQISSGATGAGAVFASGGAQAPATTDANGVATSPALVADASTGRFTATATVDGVQTPLTYVLHNVAPRLRAQSRSGTATVDRRYRWPLGARVLDSHGRPVQGVVVTFALPQAATGPGASFLGGGAQATATTNAEGKASSPPIVAGATAGSFTATASIASVSSPIVYSLRNLAGAPATIAAGAASGESASVGTRFPVLLAVTVEDKESNPVPGAVVTFSAPAGGPTGRFVVHGRHLRVVRVRTNSRGIAVAPALVAGGHSGGFAVTARSGSAKTAFALVAA
jgi:protocatechuate 3,4-dioxygenase beta subunit